MLTPRLYLHHQIQNPGKYRAHIHLRASDSASERVEFPSTQCRSFRRRTLVWLINLCYFVHNQVQKNDVSVYFQQNKPSLHEVTRTN